jgi:GH25 family lysozyme M1 (1,4-beta-N-acetylmuramidase)
MSTPLGTSNLLLPDVSQFNLPIDGSAISQAITSDKAGNFGAFIVRVGTGLDESNPENMTDDGYASTSAKLRSNGISFARYWEIHLDQDAEKQANAALSLSGPLQTGDWPYIWFDAETLGGLNGNNGADAANALLTAVKRVQQVPGWKAGIYASLDTFSQMDLAILTGIPKWVADWGNQSPQLAGLDTIMLWQFAGGDGAQAGTFAGVGGPENPHCDLSVYMLDSSVFYSEIVA